MPGPTVGPHLGPQRQRQHRADRMRQLRRTEVQRARRQRPTPLPSPCPILRCAAQLPLWTRLCCRPGRAGPRAGGPARRAQLPRQRCRDLAVQRAGGQAARRIHQRVQQHGRGRQAHGLACARREGRQHENAARPEVLNRIPGICSQQKRRCYN